MSSFNISIEQRTWQAPGATIVRVDSFAGFGQYDLNLTLRPESGALAGALRYNRELFDDELIDDMLELFDVTLRSVAERTNIPLAHHVHVPRSQADEQFALLRAPAANPSVTTRSMPRSTR